MAYSFRKFVYSSGGDTMYQLKEHLVSVGWGVKSSSNGSALGAPDNITSGTVMNTHNSWFVLQMPAISGVQRELLIQNKENNQLFFKNAYSPGNGFSGGNATTAPTATDQVFGSMSGWSHTYTGYQLFDGASSKYVIICAETSAPYGFYLATFSSIPGTGTNENAGYYSTGGIMLDPLLIGTYASLDADPYIYYCSNAYPRTFLRTEGLQNTSSDYGYGRAWGWVKYGMTGSGNYPFYLSSLGYRGSLVANPYTGKDDTCAATYVLGSWQPHIKGTSSLVRWSMQSRSTGDTLSVSGNRDRIILGHCAMPWDGSTPTF